jgi:hypothetical protein
MCAHAHSNLVIYVQHRKQNKHKNARKHTCVPRRNMRPATVCGRFVTDAVATLSPFTVVVVERVCVPGRANPVSARLNISECEEGV